MSAARNIVVQTAQTSNPSKYTQTQTTEYRRTWIILSNDQMIQIPEGADPDYVRRIEENKLRNQARPKRRRRTRRSGRPSKRINYAEQVLYKRNGLEVA